MSVKTLESCDNIADEIFDLIKPYYKGLRKSGDQPDFRKCLKSSEVEDILLTLHDIVVTLKVHPRLLKGDAT